MHALWICLIYLVSFSAFAFEETALERQEVVIQVRPNFTYDLVEKDVFSLARSSLTNWTKRLVFDPSSNDLELIAAAIRDDGKEQAVPAEHIHLQSSAPEEKHPAGLKRLEVYFANLRSSSQPVLQIHRVSKTVPPAGFFSMDFSYGVLQTEISGDTRIESPVPLFFAVHDPDGHLKVESSKTGAKYGVRIQLIKSVDARRDGPPVRVRVSSLKTWSEWAKPLKVRYEIRRGQIPKELEPEFQKIAQAGAPPFKLEKLMAWLADEFTYNGASESPEPRPLAEVAKTLSGNSADATFLMVTMLSGLNIPAEPVYAGIFSDTDPTRALHAPFKDAETFPSSGAFNHMLVRVKISDSWMLLDPVRGLSDVVHTPYYLNQMWVLPLSEAQPSQVHLPTHDYAKVRIQSDLTRLRDGGFSAQTSVQFDGEISNFLKMIYFTQGEAELSKYVEVFSSLARHARFTYRKLNFIDRSDKGWSAELTYVSGPGTRGQAEALSVPPHDLNLFRGNSLTGPIHFPNLPIQIDEAITIHEAFVKDEQNYDCLVRGPALSMDRRVQNVGGSVLIQDRLVATGAEDSAPSRERLSACVKVATLPVEIVRPDKKAFDNQVRNSKSYSLPEPLPTDPDLLRVELRKIEVWIAKAPRAELFLARGQIFRALGRRDDDSFIAEYLMEAQTALQKAVQLDPHAGEAQVQLGLNSLDLGNSELGFRAFNAAGLQANLVHQFGYLFLAGRVNEQLKRFSSALDYFQAAAAVAVADRDRLSAWSHQASVLCFGLKQCAEGLALQNKILALDKTPQRLHVAARIAAEMKDYTRADAFEKESTNQRLPSSEDP